jgi:hypothetical protein
MTTATRFMRPDSPTVMPHPQPSPVRRLSVERQVAVDLADQLGVIVLAPTHDRPLDLRSVSFGEVVGTENQLGSLVDKRFKTWHESVVHAIAHDKDVHLMAAPKRSFGQLDHRMRIFTLGACTQKDSQLLGHLEHLLTVPVDPKAAYLAGCANRDSAELFIIDQGLDGWVFSAERTGRVASEVELTEGHLQGVIHEQPTDQRFADT